MWSHTKNGWWLMESNLMKSVPTSLKLATVLESRWYLEHHGQLLVGKRPAYISG